MTRTPVLFLSHGSPMSALGGDSLSAAWETLAARLAKQSPAPTAILMISAHWTTRLPMLSGAGHPETLHDFDGFPTSLNRLRYPAPGHPALARRIKRQLADAGIATGIDANRGLDHGAWVPLRTLFPRADIPVVQLSVQPERCARHHLALGAALAPLRADPILIIASGHLVNNPMAYTGENTPGAKADAACFRDHVHANIMNNNIDSLLDWPHTAPGARSAHPTPEHFLPLFVALGAAGTRARSEWLGGSGIGDALAADHYLFAP